MRGAAAQKQQAILLLLLGTVAYMTSTMVATASTERSLTYVIGTIACILSFLNAEISIYFLIAAMLLSPEIAVGEKTSGATLSRSVTLRVDDFVLLIICVTWFVKSVLYKEIDLLKRTPLNGALFLYAFGAMFSTMLGMMNGNVQVKTGSLFVLKYIEYFLVYWMVVNTVQDEGQIKRFVLVAFVVAFIVSVVAIGQIPGGGRVSAPFEGETGEPNTLGGYLLFMMCLVGSLLFVKNKYRFPALALLVVMFIGFTYTLSRASYLGLVPALIILPLVTRRYYVLVGMLTVLLGIGAFAEALLPKVVYDRLAFTFTQQQQQDKNQVRIYGQKLDTSTSARLFVMQAAFEAFYAKPIFGYGVTGWAFLDSQYFRTLAETGLFGLSTLAFLIFRVMQVTLRSMKDLRDRDPVFFALSGGFLAGTAGLVVHAVGSNTFIIVRIMEPFWLFAAIIYLAPRVIPRMTAAPSALEQTA